VFELCINNNEKEVIMKKGTLIGLLIAWMIGVASGYFLFTVMPNALTHSGRTGVPIEKENYDNSEIAVVYARDSVLIYDIVAKISKTTFGKKVYVEYEIRNIGNRILTSVLLKIYLLDNQGNAIYEDEHYAIWTSDVYSNATGPLKPNYIRNRSAFVPSALEVEARPSEWAVGKVTLKVIEIKFD
jgi:hypothetical protein